MAHTPLLPPTRRQSVDGCSPLSGMPNAPDDDFSFVEFFMFGFFFSPLLVRVARGSSQTRRRIDPTLVRLRALRIRGGDAADTLSTLSSLPTQQQQQETRDVAELGWPAGLGWAGQGWLMTAASVQFAFLAISLSLSFFRSGTLNSSVVRGRNPIPPYPSCIPSHPIPFHSLPHFFRPSVVYHFVRVLHSASPFNALRRSTLPLHSPTD